VYVQYSVLNLLLYVYVPPQDLLYVWTDPKLCMGGLTLPEKKTLPCEGMEFWVRLGTGMGAFTAVLLVSLTCYFWKKNKRYNSLFPSCKLLFFFLSFLSYYSTSFLYSFLILSLLILYSFSLLLCVLFLPVPLIFLSSPHHFLFSSVILLYFLFHLSLLYHQRSVFLYLIISSKLLRLFPFFHVTHFLHHFFPLQYWFSNLCIS